MLKSEIVVRSQNFRLFLQNELSSRLRKDPQYSLRQFAKLLRIDPSALVKILKGDRKCGKRLIERFGERLGLAPDERSEFISFQMNSEKKPDDLPEYQQVTLDTFRLISDWYHMAILELIRVDTFRPDPKWIASVLRIPVNEVNFSIERMIRMGILEIHPDGRWIDRYEVSTNIVKPYFDSAQKKLQKQILEKAIYSLEHVPVAFRDQSAMTMAIDTEKLPEAKERIKKFRRELAKFLSRGDKRDQVYHLSLSLYPVSNIEIENNKNSRSTKSQKS